MYLGNRVRQVTVALNWGIGQGFTDFLWTIHCFH